MFSALVSTWIWSIVWCFIFIMIPLWYHYKNSKNPNFVPWFIHYITGVLVVIPIVVNFLENKSRVHAWHGICWSIIVLVIFAFCIEIIYLLVLRYAHYHYKSKSIGTISYCMYKYNSKLVGVCFILIFICILIGIWMFLVHGIPFTDINGSINNMY